MINGACHCEKVKWSYDNTNLESVTACNCTLCRRYGALWAYGYLGEGITVEGDVSSYSRGSQINDFNFCSSCGCMMYYISRKLNEKNQRRMAVNLRQTLQPEAILNLPIDHFDGLDKFEDLPHDGRCVKDLWY